jgi:glycosyltransferase involved in cell wall biosynthesis
MSKSLLDYPILCLSHLRWETTLFQRPQQLMTRFAAMGARVFYLSQMSTRRWAASLVRGKWGELGGRAGPNLLWRSWPYLPGARFSPEATSANWRFYGLLVRSFLAFRRRRPLLLWVYHPSAAMLLDRIRHDLLVYDCMDPFVAFRAERIKERVERQERALIGRADVVFTGGPSLQAAKEGINPRTYCFSSGVDLDHFARALDPTRLVLPDDVARLPHPVLGYWGAVDERIDFDLLAQLCRKFSGGSVVLLGPPVGMNRPPLDLPNFHWLGEKEYAQLPAYLAAFDVCLMPFVASALTASISPTKTPEYLAGGRPVVSTPIPDVARVWGDVVAIGESGEAFVAAVERELRRPRPDPQLADAARRRAATWDDIARAMREKIETVLAEKRTLA